MSLPVDASCSQQHTVILVDGGENKALNYAIKLIVLVLNSNYTAKDDIGFLICKRDALKCAEAFDNPMVYDFDGLLTQYGSKNVIDRNMANFKTFDLLLRYCFENRIVKYSHYRDEITDVMCAKNPNIEIHNDVNMSPSKCQTGNDVVDKSLRYKFLKTQENMERCFGRLMIRFVDEMAVRTSDKDSIPVGLNLPACIGDKFMWNYIHTVNELGGTDSLISFVVVVGLAQMQVDNDISKCQQSREPDKKEEATSHNIDGFHPFSATSINSSGDICRNYNEMYINNYAFSIAITLNAINTRIHTNEIPCKDNELPKLLLFETLPQDPSDACKFVSFLSERFSTIYHVR